MHFKVVTPTMTSLHGVPDYLVNYKVGEWAHPVISESKLFVFDNQDDAEYLMDQYPSIMFICEANNPKPIVKGAEGINFELFWKEETDNCLPLPKGSIGCDSLRLTMAIASNLRTTTPLC